MEDTTARQTEYLKFINSFIELNGYAPSYREITVGLDVKIGNPIQKMIEILEKKELIIRTPSVARSLRLTKKAKKLIKTLDM